MSEEKDIDLKRCDVCGVSCRQWVERKLGSVYCSWSCVEKKEQEAKNYSSEAPFKAIIKELRTRVAELTKKGENLCTSHGLLLCAHDTLKKKNEELQNRLSTLNAEIEGNGGYKDMLKGFQFKIESLESKLFTLLKASEGMEKALENQFKAFSESEFDYEFKEAWLDGLYDECKQALADFRALKEAK